MWSRERGVRCDRVSRRHRSVEMLRISPHGRKIEAESGHSSFLTFLIFL
jgi:hypothetical protein